MMKKSVEYYMPKISSLYRRYRDYIEYRLSEPKETVFGFEMVGKEDLDRRLSGSDELYKFLEYAKDCDIFVDIGAHTGIFTLLAKKYDLYKISFEPNKYNFDLLKKNIHINKLKNVEIYNIALTDSVGVCPIYGGGQGASLREDWGGITSNYFNLTSTNKLDNILKGRFEGKSMLVKLDAEGKELSVLKGGVETLNRSPTPVWIVENSITRNYGSKRNPNYIDIFSIFWQNGYEAVPLGPGQSEVISRKDVEEWYKKGRRPKNGVNYLFR